MKHASLTLPPRLWQSFRQEMLAARRDGEEVAGFFFCRRHPLDRGRVRLLPRVWAVPGSDCYEQQSVAGLVLDQRCHHYLLEQIVRQGYDVVHVHTHPGMGIPDFSPVDDRHEREYARFLARLPGRPRLLSAVFNESLARGRIRLWPAGGRGDPRPAETEPSWCGTMTAGGDSQLPARFERQRIFGVAAQEALGRLKIGLVGCGGIGAVLAEQLARLGVRRWLLIDPDRVEVSNLNRLPGATPAMARAAWPKTKYVNRLIRTAWPRDAEVQALTAAVEEPNCRQALAGCDLLVAATDNHHSRLVVQEIALRHVRPLLCLGTHIELSEEPGSRRFLCRVTVPPLDGGWCLACSGVIDPAEAARETASDDVVKLLHQAGYVEGVPAPAVYWANGTCASLGAYVVHGAVAGLLDLNGGLDWIVDVSHARWLQMEHDACPTCWHCSPEGLWAAGPNQGS